MPRIDVIDISHWNSIKSFPDIKKSGVIGVIQKATEGTGYVDPTYAPRMGQAKSAGLYWGAYHFLKHGNVQKQMEHFVRNAKLPKGSRWAIDYEDVNCTLEDLRQSLEILAKLEPTAQICVYAGGLLKGQVGSAKHSWLEPYPLWLAHYTSGTPKWPTQIWPNYALWQFSEKGSVSGVSGNCDTNEFNGNAESCAKWIGPVTAAPAPPVAAPTPIVEPVVVRINVPDGVEVVVAVNGKAVSGQLPPDEDRMLGGGE
jgi:GH25 family lysozyme M1 (1,4-beta-N-acetylmuramidase)